MRLSFFAACAAVAISGVPTFAGSFGQTAFNYVPGTSAGTNFNTNKDAATGLPTPTGDGFYGALTPFNPAYATDQVLVLKSGGSITLQLSAPVNISPAAQLGIFDNTGIADQDPDSAFGDDFSYIAGGRGFAGSPLIDFGGGVANISVSKFGIDFVPLKASPFSLHTPTNGYTDNSVNLGMASIGNNVADFYKPFTGTLGDLADRWYSTPNTGPTILDLFNGSAGGTWISLANVPLDQINYVKFDVPSGGRLALDAITAIPEPGALAILAFGTILLRRRR